MNDRREAARRERAADVRKLERVLGDAVVPGAAVAWVDLAAFLAILPERMRSTLVYRVERATERSYEEGFIAGGRP